MFRFVTSISDENPNCCMSMFLTALLAVLIFSSASRRTKFANDCVRLVGWFYAGIRCAMSISLIYISLTPICLKSCRQRFAVCSEDSRSATAIQWFWNWTDSCIFQMNQSISKVGRRHQRLSLTWVSFSLSLRMHISWMPGTHRTVQIQIQLIWPYSLAMNHCHSRSSITFFGSVINFHT